MRRPLALTAAAALAVLAVSTAPTASAADIPNVSKNVDLLVQLPEQTLISGTFARTGNFFYTSRANGLTVFDTTNPRLPVPLGTITQAEFENEAMTYAEKMVNGVLRRYIFVGNDLVQATGAGTSTGTPAIGRVGGREIVVFDVTVPTAITQVKRVPTTTSTHTLQCVDVACSYAYTAGNAGTGNPGTFSIIDFRGLGDATKLADLKEVKTVESPSAKGPFAAGH